MPYDLVFVYDDRPVQSLSRSGFEVAVWPVLGMLAAGAVVCVAALAVMSNSRIADRIIDRPNHRSMHVESKTCLPLRTTDHAKTSHNRLRCF